MLKLQKAEKQLVIAGLRALITDIQNNKLKLARRMFAFDGKLFAGTWQELVRLCAAEDAGHLLDSAIQRIAEANALIAKFEESEEKPCRVCLAKPGDSCVDREYRLLSQDGRTDHDGRSPGKRSFGTMSRPLSGTVKETSPKTGGS